MEKMPVWLTPAIQGLVLLLQALVLVLQSPPTVSVHTLPVPVPSVQQLK